MMIVEYDEDPDTQEDLSEDDRLLRRSAPAMLAEMSQGTLALFGQWGHAVPKHHPQEIVDCLTNGTYADMPVTDKDRGEHEKLLAKIEVAMAEGIWDIWYANYEREIYLFQRFLDLTDSELARLLHVDEPIHDYDDEFGRKLVMEFTADTVFRLIQVSAAAEQVALCSGEAGTKRWLREAEQNPKFPGVVPVDEMAQDDAVRLRQYRACVEYVYAPEMEWYTEDYDSMESLFEDVYDDVEDWPWPRAW